MLFILIFIHVRGNRTIKMHAGKLPEDFYKVFGYVTVYWWCEGNDLYIKVGYASLDTPFYPVNPHELRCPEWTIHRDDYNHWIRGTAQGGPIVFKFGKNVGDKIGSAGVAEIDIRLRIIDWLFNTAGIAHSNVKFGSEESIYAGRGETMKDDKRWPGEHAGELFKIVGGRGLSDSLTVFINQVYLHWGEYQDVNNNKWDIIYRTVEFLFNQPYWTNHFRPTSTYCEVHKPLVLKGILRHEREQGVPDNDDLSPPITEDSALLNDLDKLLEEYELKDAPASYLRYLATILANQYGLPPPEREAQRHWRDLRNYLARNIEFFRAFLASLPRAEPALPETPDDG